MSSNKFNTIRQLNYLRYYLSENEVKKKQNELSNLQSERSISVLKKEEIEKNLKILLEESKALKSAIFQDDIKESVKLKKSNDLVLKEQDNRINDLKDILMHLTVIETLTVISEFECKNGLIGMKRFVVLRLIRMLDEKKVRNIIGIGSEVYFWKTLPIWRHYVPIAKLCFQFETNNAFTKVSNSEVKFTNNARWIFQNADHDFSYRIYHLRMTVDGTVGGNYVAANLGVCVQKNLPMCTTRRMGYFDCGLTHHASIFRIGRIPGCVYCTFDRQYCAHSIKTETRTYEIRPIFCAAYKKKMPKFVFGMSIGIKLDLLERTIHFFYNGVLVPYVVRNVPASVAIGFCGSPTNNVTMKGVSLEKRTKPTVDPSVPCIPVPYSDKDVL